MNIFQLTLKNFATIGIDPNLVLQPYPFNEKIFLGFLILGSGVICNFMYIFYEAKTYTEYTRTIYMCSLELLIIFTLTIIIFKVKMFFKLFNDDCQNLVNTSKYEIKYHHFHSKRSFSKMTPFQH